MSINVAMMYTCTVYHSNEQFNELETKFESQTRERKECRSTQASAVYSVLCTE